MVLLVFLWKKKYLNFHLFIHLVLWGKPSILQIWSIKKLVLAIQKVLLSKSVELNPICSASTIFSQRKMWFFFFIRNHKKFLVDWTSTRVICTWHKKSECAKSFLKASVGGSLSNSKVSVRLVVSWYDPKVERKC